MAPDFPEIDFECFHRQDLPRRLAGTHGKLASKAVRDLPSLAFAISGAGAFTYRPTADALEILAGEALADCVVEIDLESWRGLVHELEAPAGLLYSGRARCRRGDPIALMRWESALRALYNGRPPYAPDEQRLPDRHGYPLDPNAVYTLAEDRAELSHFLDTAGYLFLRDVFSAAEVEAFLGESAELEAEARPGDKLSWWGRNEAGEEKLCRVTRASAKPHLGALPRDPRILDLVALSRMSLVHKRGEGEGVTVIYKRPGMSEGGLGDLPWHRDCGMGGHAVMCPTLTVSIYLTEATPESGELAMLPASHRASFNAHERGIDANAFAAHFRAQPGAVSLHYGDTVHAAPPPTQRDRASHRISAILSFAPAQAKHHRGEASYNDVLHQRDDGQIEHLETLVERTLRRS